MSDDMVMQSDPTSQTTIPLSVNKPPNFKIIGVICLVIVIILINAFVLKKTDSHEKSSISSETYSSKSVNPVSHSENTKSDTTALAIDQNQEYLKRKLAEAKAKDFIERLQAVQSVETGGTTGQVTHNQVEITGDRHNNPSARATFSNDPNTAFLQATSNSDSPERAYASQFAPQPYLIGQGKFIFATLSVAIHSDLPGQVSAIVSQDVYGEQGHQVLIPRGSRLIGEYKSGLANNQSRLFVVWTRVIQPNGISVMIGSEGTDALGEAGLTGNVNGHFFARFGTATLISLIAAGASTVGVNPDDQYNSMAAYRQAASQSLAQQSANVLGQTANIPPTVQVAQGSKVVVFVNKDLDFSSVYR
jgi:type IV secretion system protein VirB10